MDLEDTKERLQVLFQNICNCRIYSMLILNTENFWRQ